MGNDRRTRRTRKMLYEALTSLLFEKNFDEIVVQDILDRADIGRSTFYMHFEDKESLFMSGFGKLEDELRAAHSETVRLAKSSEEKVIAFSLKMFEHAHGARSLYMAIRNNRAGELAMRSIREILQGIIEEAINRSEIKKRKKEKALPSELLAQYLSSSFVTVLVWWIENNTTLSPTEANNHYRSLVLPTLIANYKS